MTTGFAGIQDTRTNPRTRGWYDDASGGFILETCDAWDLRLARRVFPRITSSSRIDRSDIGRFVLARHQISTLPVADQVRELKAALSANKSELARMLRVSRPTVYDWLGGGQPNVDNVARIRMLLRLLSEARVSASNPLLPRSVRSPIEPEGQLLLDLLCGETIDETAVKHAIQRAKALGDAMDARRKERESRLRAAGFEEPDAEQRKANLATNVALMEWPRE